MAAPVWIRKLFSPHPAPRALGSEVVFAPEFLAALERLRLVALKALGGGWREGHRLGAYKGGQLEFHGHRSYAPGDDLRYLDWNSLARLGRPYIKEFAREEAGNVHLFLDATASMRLGTPSKWTFARRVAALFTHVALSSQDRVSLYVYRENGGWAQFPPAGVSSGTQGYLNFLSACEVSEAQQPGRPMAQHALEHVANQFLRGQPKRGRAIFLSDFWQSSTDIVNVVARLSRAGYDVSGIHILAPEECQPGARGELLVRSVEEAGELELRANPELLNQYLHELEGHQQAVEEVFRRRGGQYLMVSSDASIEDVLIRTLRQCGWVR